MMFFKFNFFQKPTPELLGSDYRTFLEMVPKQLATTYIRMHFQAISVFSTVWHANTNIPVPWPCAVCLTHVHTVA